MAVVVVLLIAGVLGLATIDASVAPSGDPLAVALAAAGRTASVDSARLSATSQTTIEGSSPVPVPAITVEGVFEFAGAMRSSLVMKAGGLQIRLLNDGTTAYIELPVRTAGPRWVAAPTAKLTSGDSPFAALSGPTLGGGSNPLGTLDQLKTEGLVRSATRGERAEVRGVATDVFHLVLDGARFKSAVSTMFANIPAAGAFGALRLEDPALDLYIDGDGLVRRQVLRLTVGVDALGRRFSATITSKGDLYDFGTPVTLDLPPADQVQDVESLSDVPGLFAGPS
jgi:hypothetical protein